MKKTLLIIALVPLFFYSVFSAQNILWEPQAKRILTESEIEGMIPKGENFNTLGFDKMVADLYWIKSVQYIGGNIFSTDRKGLFPLIDLITSLDPKFSRAYKIGMLLLPDEGKMKETEALIAKAEEKNADDWRIYYDAGFYYFYYAEDNKKALEYYQKCVEFSGCITGGARMVKNLQTRLGKYEIAIQQRVDDLLNPDSSQEEKQISQKKIQESASLLLLNDASAQYLAQGKEISELDDLKGFKFIPTDKNFFNYLIQNQRFFGFEFTVDGEYLLVDDVLLKTPYQYNYYLWSAEDKKVRTRWF